MYFSSYFCCVVAMERKEKETEKVRKEGARRGSETIAETKRERESARVKGGVRGEDGAGVRGHARESTSAAVSRWRVSVCVRTWYAVTGCICQSSLERRSFSRSRTSCDV